MRPSFNFSFSLPKQQPRQPRQPQQQHQNLQLNGFQNSLQSHQLGMTNPLVMGQPSNPPFMSNPLMGQLNNQMPCMQLHPQLFSNLSNLPQQQLHQLSLPSNLNQLLPTLLGNLQFGVANSNLLGHSFPLVQHNLVQSSHNLPAFNSPSQPPLHSFNPLTYPSIPPHQNQNLQPPIFSEPQGQPLPRVNNSISSSRGSDFRNKFTRNPKAKGVRQGFQNSYFRQADNGKRKFGFHNDHKGKGHYSKMAAELNGSDSANTAKERKRSLALVYTEKEIQQWREERRKNYPSKANVEKKLKRNASDCNADEEAKMRCQRLKEILAKQVELGVEVAEVPSHYFSNTNEQVNGDKVDNGHLIKGQQVQNKHDRKGRFHGRHNKRRHGEKERFSKKPRFQDKDPSKESSLSMRKPTLLEKLLSADIKRDKRRLLQVLRFMVTNAFFKEWPEQPLKFPLVIVEENGCELKETGEDASSLSTKITTEILDANHNDDDNDVSADDSSRDEAVENDGQVERCVLTENRPLEEGNHETDRNCEGDEERDVLELPSKKGSGVMVNSILRAQKR